MPWRKYISAPYLKWPFWVVVGAMWLWIFGRSRPHGELQWDLIVPQVGQLAWRLLVLTIFLSLLRKLFPRCATLVRVLPLRKHSGLLAFLIAGSHGVSELVRNGIHKDWEAIFAHTLSLDSSITYGATAFLLLLPLFLTSTEWAVKTMGIKAWFWLHKLVHPAFILVGLHYAFAGASIRLKPLVVLGIYLLGYLFLQLRRFWKKHPPVDSDAAAFV